MIARLIYLFIFSLISFSSLAQQFKGKVLDKETNEPIPFADVFFMELQTGTSTDENGIFVLDDLLNSKIHIQISFMGYKTLHEEIDINEIHEKIFYIEPSHIDLEEVVFSVPGGKLQGENIVSIERKNLSQIEHSSITLAEAISNIPGVDQNTTGTGIGKPVIRGLSGNRIVTYAQGIRIENQQWGAEHGLGVSDIGVESVEVIKGPASLLYGSDAIGGVLYFIDERYAQHNHLEGNFNTRVLSNALGTYNDLGIKMHNNEFKMNVFGGYISNADYKIPGGERVSNTRFDEKSFKSSIGYNTRKWVSNFHYSFLQNNFGITKEAEYSKETTRSPKLPFQKINHHNISFDNTFYIHDARVNLVLGFSENDRQEFEENTTIAALDMRLKSLTYNLKWYSSSIGDHLSLIAGSQGMHQTNDNFGEETLIPDATTNDFGLFSLANYDIKNFQFQLGLRGDRRVIDTREQVTEETDFPSLRKSYGNLNYSAGGMYGGENIIFRINLASGFRAPNTSELLSDGVHEGTHRYELGNPNLESEYATQIDFTFDYRSGHFNFSFNPFFNYIDNYIFLSPIDSVIEEMPVYEYLQTKARLYGGETGIHFHPHSFHWLHIESNLSIVLAEDNNGNPLPLIPATRLNTLLKAEFSRKGNVRIKDVFFQHIYKFDQDRTGEFETSTPGYQLVNIGANLEIATRGKPIQISAGVKNLFNTRYIDHLSRLKPMEIPNPGINFYLGLKIGFATKIGKEL